MSRDYIGPILSPAKNGRGSYMGIGLRDVIALRTLEILLEKSASITATEVAHIAYGIADAMIERRNRGEDE